MASADIVKVAAKIRALRQDHPVTEVAIRTSYSEDEVAGVLRVTGHCLVVQVATDKVLSEAHGTRCLRPPVSGAMGHNDTRDPDRAMTQATGRALGLMGYTDGESLEGDTDEPDVAIMLPPDGWSSWQEHEDRKSYLTARARDLPPVFQDALKVWWTDTGWSWPLTQAQVDTYESKVAQYEAEAQNVQTLDAHADDKKAALL